jgi:phosphoribosyl 1,2-cyclic phosphodiesterase
VKITFWGVRGSIPIPGEDTRRYGGNTSCVEIVTDSGGRFICDCGTGIIPLGEQLMRERAFAAGAGASVVLLSHTHWDHIQGFPFFQPLHKKGNRFVIYGPGKTKGRLEGIMEGQLSPEFSAIHSMGNLGAKLEFREIEEGEFTLGPATVRTVLLSHPTMCLGYRVECDGRSVVFATDVEYKDAADMKRVTDFCRGADLIIHDAMYTHEEYPRFKGWGHTTMEDTVQLTRDAKVGSVVLFHHDPDRTDDHLDALVTQLQGEAAKHGGPAIHAAREGLTLTL